MTPNRTEAWRPRLYLVTPPVSEPSAIRAGLTEALGAADVAAVLLRLAAADERTLINRAKALAPLVQDKGVAFLLDGFPGIAAHAGADGAHVTGIDAFQAALATLKPTRIAGCGGLASRHDAMVAAEAGADYVMFGEPDELQQRPSFDAVVDRVTWWSELFEIPCVGFAGSMAEVAPLVAAGADFVAVGAWIFEHAKGMAATIAEASNHLALVEATG